MKLKSLCVAMLLAAGSIGIAYANPVNVISNGNFTASSPPNGSNGMQVGLGGNQFVTDWIGNGYTIWYPNANSAVNGCATTEFHSGTGGHCSTLNAVGTPVPGTNGTFVALDGDSTGLQGTIQQQINNLTPNQTYKLTFYWGTTQETQASNKLASSNQFLTVTLGGSSLSTSTVANNPWGSFTGDGCTVTGTNACAWNQTTMMFTPTSMSELLEFFSIGQPSSGPPMILLTGVSMTAVPEPSSLGMFGGGLLGLGLLTLFMRRRALRKQGAAGDLV